jgi:hypothetical protein
MYTNTSFFSGNSKFPGKELVGNLGALQRIGGLTFYKDFSRPGNLNADFSVGSPIATYTSTSGTPTFTGGGYNATTANSDVLKYLIAGNRTAAQETIVIKFSLNQDTTAYGANALILASDTKSRDIVIQAATDAIYGRANGTDNGTVSALSSTKPLQNITYIYAFSITSSTPQVTCYVNGSSEATSTTNTWGGAIAWGTYFQVGCNNNNLTQMEGVVKSIAFFSRNLSASEVLALNNLM